MGSADTATLTRPILVSVETDVHGGAVTADVVLKLGGNMVRGNAMRAASEPHGAVAEATLRAISSATGIVMRAHAAELTTISDTPVAVVIVDIPAMEVPLAGCVVRTTHDPGLFAKAALDAVNRIVCSRHLMAELARRSAYAH